MDEHDGQHDAAPEHDVTVRPDTVQRATFEALMAKARRERNLDIPLPDGENKLRLRLVAISSTEYDDLVSSCPPSSAHREQGAIYDQDKFGPRLISRVVVDPAMSVDEATALYTSPNWSGGEIGSLFRACVALCQAGVDVPFNVPV